MYNRTAVQQTTAEKLIHQQPTISPCVYNNSTAILQQQQKKRKRRDREIQLTLRPESSALPLSQQKCSDYLPSLGGKFESRRSPSLVATSVCSPGIARAAVWVGLGAVARFRGIGWSPGAAGVEQTYFISIKLNIPMMTTMLNTQACSTVRVNRSCLYHQVCIYGAFSSNEGDPSCSLLDTWYLTYPADFE